MSREQLEALLDVQAHDTTVDQLRHRHAALASRTAYEAGLAEVAALTARRQAVTGRRDEVAQQVQRLEDEATLAKEQADGVETRLYSGEVTSPRELQDLQADLEQLRRRQRGIEDRELECMEAREVVDAELADVEGRLDEVQVETDRLQGVLAGEEAAIDAEIATERAARAEIVAGIEGRLVDLYERCRKQGNGIGVARLVGNVCQGCRLTIPATEVDRIRKADGSSVAHCDNCGAILVA